MRRHGRSWRTLTIGLACAGALGLAAQSLAVSRRSRPTLLGPGTRLLAIAAAPGGKVVAVGQSGLPSHVDVLVTRFTASGALDRSFGSHGQTRGPALSGGSVARAVAVAPNGSIVVVGSSTDSTGQYPHSLIVERFDSHGRLDRRFGSGGVAALLSSASAGQGGAVAIRPDGRIVAGGSSVAAGQGGTAPRTTLVGLTPSGGLDRSFAGGGIDVVDLGAYSSVRAIALQRDGRILVAGSQAPHVQVTSALLARLTPGGQVDRGFAGGLYVHQYAINAAFSSFNTLAVQPDGRILAGGAATAGLSRVQGQAVVARFTPSGVPDGGFGAGGVARVTSAVGSLGNPINTPGAYALAQAGGQVVAAGTSSNLGELSLTLWGFTSRGQVARRFGSNGSLTLRLARGYQSEGAAAVKVGRRILAAGDQSATGVYRGLLAGFSLS
jgi:uncharacterized delta-60 repeat protein